MQQKEKFMEVNFNPIRSFMSGASQAMSRKGPSSVAGNTVPTADPSVSLKTSPTTSPPVRSEKVAQASALVADGDYPPDGDLNRMADLLSKHLQN